MEEAEQKKKLDVIMSHTEKTDLKETFQYNTRQSEPDETFDER